MARPKIHEQPMTAAQRKARSRALYTASIQAEAFMARAHIETTRSMLATTIGGTTADDELLAALDALERLDHILTN